MSEYILSLVGKEGLPTENTAHCPRIIQSRKDKEFTKKAVNHQQTSLVWNTKGSHKIESIITTTFMIVKLHYTKV